MEKENRVKWVAIAVMWIATVWGVVAVMINQ